MNDNIAAAAAEKEQSSSASAAIPGGMLQQQQQDATAISFLRTIPEDKSDLASSVGGSRGSSSLAGGGRGGGGQFASTASNCGSVNSSTGAVDSLKAESQYSDAIAIVAGGTESDSVVAEAGAVGGGGAPSPARGHQPKEDSACRTFWTRRNIWLCAALAVLLVGVLSAIIAVVVSDDGTEAVGPGLSPGPTPLDPMKRAVDEILLMTVASPSVLDDPATPQARARQWMLYQDELVADILAQDEDNDGDGRGDGAARIQQRYALVVFYYATGGPHWNATSDAVNNGTTTASSSTATTTTGTSNSKGSAASSFLQPALSECDWEGVTCADKLRYRRRRHLQERRTSVTRLFFNARNLTGALPVELGPAVPTVQEVDMSHNALQGTLPEELVASWSSLLYLDVSSNQLTGTLPTEPSVWSQTLDWLDLSRNELRGSIPSAVWSLPELRFLYLSQNIFSGRIARLDDDGEEVFDSASNGEDGSPSSTGAPTGEGEDAANKKSLKQVLLFNNSLTGPLPSWFTDLEDLEYWVAFRNQLNGTLPDPPTKDLFLLDLSYNNLTGTIPTSLWTTINSPPLINLTLDHNQFSGPIPSAPILRQDMVKLWLHENLLTGPIPDMFAVQWRKLADLRVHGNGITGQLGPRLEQDGASFSEEELEGVCTEIWPDRATFKADCLEYLNAVPPVLCDCCTECV